MRANEAIGAAENRLWTEAEVMDRSKGVTSTHQSEDSIRWTDGWFAKRLSAKERCWIVRNADHMIVATPDRESSVNAQQRTTIPDLWAITGYKGHGKDTMARFMASTDRDFYVLHFADRLKEVLMAVCLLSLDQVDGAYKELPFLCPLEIDRFVPALSDALELPLQARGRIAKSPRELMQFVGTEYVRFIQNDYWTEYLRKKILEAGCKVIVPDVRFHNEMEMLRSLGARSIRVVRRGYGSSWHGSEKDIPRLDVDAEFEFREGQLDLMQAVATGIMGLRTARQNEDQAHVTAEKP